VLLIVHDRHADPIWSQAGGANNGCHCRLSVYRATMMCTVLTTLMALTTRPLIGTKFHNRGLIPFEYQVYRYQHGYKVVKLDYQLCSLRTFPQASIPARTTLTDSMGLSFCRIAICCLFGWRHLHPRHVVDPGWRRLQAPDLVSPLGFAKSCCSLKLRCRAHRRHSAVTIDPHANVREYRAR